MIIKNEFVDIKIGDKSFRKHNMFLNSYLKLMRDCLIKQDRSQTTNFTTCFLKLDTPLDVSEDDFLTRFDFDVRLTPPQKNISTISNGVTITYGFDDSYMFVYTENDETQIYYGIESANEILAGRQIMGIGFGEGATGVVYTYLDTRNYGLIIQPDELIKIDRVDNFRTDGIISGYDYPRHLVQDTMNAYESATQTAKFCYLAEVGFGTYPGQVLESYKVVYENPAYNEILLLKPTDNSIAFEFNIPEKMSEVYPTNSLYPNANLFPGRANTKYIIFKYKFYEIHYGSGNGDIGEAEFIDLDEEYLEAIRYEDTGDTRITIKIERESE